MNMDDYKRGFDDGLEMCASLLDHICQVQKDPDFIALLQSQAKAFRACKYPAVDPFKTIREYITKDTGFDCEEDDWTADGRRRLGDNRYWE